MNKDVIKFIRTKDFRYLQDIGQGGTGKTILIKDDVIDEYFVCKKYSPYYEEDADIYYSNFLTEIKILHRLFHKNIVRVFSYYLYPDSKTGYILMDYIKGATISRYIEANPDRLNDIFLQLLEGFRHLEENEILHRDIRPENILITEEGVLKIIDLGFGKQIQVYESYDKSISLNWRYPKPDDFAEGTYSPSTEVYFVGKLIEEIIKENQIEKFGYWSILKRMIVKNPANRFQTFLAIHRENLIQESNLLEFDFYDREVYKNFASSIDSLVTKIRDDAVYVTDIDKIIKSLKDIFQVSSLEDYVQNPNQVLLAFIKGEFYFMRVSEFMVLHLKSFIELLVRSSVDRQKVIINNLWQRFDKKTRYSHSPLGGDLPF